MNYRIQVLAVLGSIGLALIIFELIRKRRLMEKYSLLWFISVIVLVVFSLWRDLLEGVAALMGVYYAPSALFLIMAFCGMALFLHFTIVISKLTEQNKSLAQRVGILQEKIETLELECAPSHVSKKEEKVKPESGG